MFSFPGKIYPHQILCPVIYHNLDFANYFPVATRLDQIDVHSVFWVADTSNVVLWNPIRRDHIWLLSS